MKKRIQFIPCLLLLLACLAAGSYGQQNPDRKDLRENRRDLAASSVSLVDDRRDFDRLSDLVMRWDDLRKRGNSAELQEVQKRIEEELRRDLKESVAEAQQTKREVRESAEDKNAAHRELRHEKTDHDGDRTALRDDRRDLRREKRDLRDDVKDAKQAEEMLQKKRDVARRLVTLQNQIDASGKAGDKTLQNQQLALIEEYLKLSREEIRVGLREKAEDRREIREDRRERREDRRD